MRELIFQDTESIWSTKWEETKYYPHKTNLWYLGLED